MRPSGSAARSRPSAITFRTRCRWTSGSPATTATAPYAFGIGGASDRIDSTNGVAEDKHRRTVDLLLGVTQALSADAIVQSNLTCSDGHGYYSDPYKTIDVRPIAGASSPG